MFAIENYYIYLKVYPKSIMGDKSYKTLGVIW